MKFYQLCAVVAALAVPAASLLAEETSNKSWLLRDALNKWPEADSDGDNILTMTEAVAYFTSIPGLSGRSGSPDPNMRRPISGHDSVFIEELTWLEVRDAIRSGKTTAIIATGGVEQNGPYLATGKHNIVLRPVTEAIALKLGDALVAPIVPFVPEGHIDPPSGHMRYAGTISVSKSTFKSLLRDIANSLRVHGFKCVIFIGDSGENQEPMFELASELTIEWQETETTAHFITEYYNNPRVAKWIKRQGITEVDEGHHDNLQYTAQMMVVDPETVRMKQRKEAGKFSINGVDLRPAAKTIALGRQIVDYQSDVAVKAIRKARGY